jgi:enamine deaminase RidA (YjgF/YER057c/UK114 family)
MRKTLAILSIAAATAALAAPSQAAEITRIKGPGAAIILAGAIVPPGSEIFYLSGQLASPIDPAKASTPPTMADLGDTKTQTISVLNKIKALLESKGYKMSDSVKMTIFAAGDPAKGGKLDFAGINEGFKMFYGTAENPNTVARSAVQVAALANPAALIEIEVIAAKAPK